MYADEEKKFSYSKGDPTVLGARLVGNGVNFAVSIPNETECRLNIYKKGEYVVCESIKLDDSYRIGNVFSVYINDFDYEKFEYLYEVKNKIFIDPYARKVVGRDVWAEVVTRKKTRLVRGGFFFKDFDWEDDCKLNIPYSESIFYKAHLRGMTCDESSNVKKKGTFAGFREKIPYLKKLGITAVVLLPIYEFDEIMINEFIMGPEEPIYMDYKTLEKKQNEFKKQDHFVKMHVLEGVIPYKINYWGYSEKCNYFAPKASYAFDTDNAVNELKNLVRELHKSGIELIMEISFVPTVNKQLITDCLKYWVREYHIDGFNFNNNVVPVDYVATEPLLADTKLITNYFDIDTIYNSDFEPKNINLAEANDGFMVDTRRYLKGDEEQVQKFTNRFRRNPQKYAVINYISNYYGFTLNDLYTYDVKHNDDNGEYNRDGTEYNYSWNCGLEGKTKKTKIIKLRKKMIKNAFTLMILSQGTPMLLAGDEICNSQDGNNNAYCQDCSMGWINWNVDEFNKEIYDFVENIISIRKNHQILHMSKELRIMDYMSKGYPDLSYHGQKLWYPDFSNYSRILGIMLCGDYAITNIEKEADDYFYIAINMHWEPHRFDLPDLPKELRWEVLIDTNIEENRKNYKVTDVNNYRVTERTIIVFISSKK